MVITAKSKLLDVLEAFPQLEAQIIQAAPAFNNLKNPVLRRTVGRLATVEKAARIGGLDTAAFVNALRRAAGQAEIAAGNTDDASFTRAPGAGDPPWVAGEPQFVVNGAELLARGEVPLERVNELLPQLEPGRTLLLITNFEPLPMIDSIRKQRREAFHKLDPAQPGRHLTFFR